MRMTLLQSLVRDIYGLIQIQIFIVINQLMLIWDNILIDKIVTEYVVIMYKI